MDLIEEVSLPSEGKIYEKEIKWKNQIRAPRLCEKGIGDLTRKRKLQANVLKKCLQEDLGIDPYDLHTSDFVYLNLRQRMAARGNEMDLTLVCQSCGARSPITVDLSKLNITKPKLPFDLIYKTADDHEIKLRYFTPRILDDIKQAVEDFKEQFPEADQNISLQETCRAIIVTVDGEKKTFTQMTHFLLNCYEIDLIRMIDKAAATNFGPQLIQRKKCPNCGEEIVYSVSPDNG